MAGFFPRGRKILVDRPVKGDTMASVKFRQRIYAAASLILLLDSLLVSLIIARVPCTFQSPAYTDLSQFYAYLMLSLHHHWDGPFISSVGKGSRVLSLPAIVLSNGTWITHTSWSLVADSSAWCQLPEFMSRRHQNRLGCVHVAGETLSTGQWVWTCEQD